jgi:polyisoprenoid-binding protein YceI
MKTLPRLALALLFTFSAGASAFAQAADNPPGITGSPLPEGAAAPPEPAAPIPSPGVPVTPAAPDALSPAAPPSVLAPAETSDAAATAPGAPGAEAAASNLKPGEETYAIDPVHSHVGFKVKHLFSNVTGRFNDFSGTIVGNPATPEEARVNVEIRVASIDTKDGKRDTHLRSEEFFNVEQFPTIQFVSKRVSRTGEETAFVIGDLTLRGVTKEVILQTKFLGRGKGMTGRIHTGWEARTALKRSDFGLTWGKAIEGTQLVGNDIEIELQIEAVEPKNEAAAPAEPPRPPERALPEIDGVTPPTEGRPAPAAPSTPAAASQPQTSTPAPVPTPTEPAPTKPEGESVPGTTETATPPAEKGSAAPAPAPAPAGVSEA